MEADSGTRTKLNLLYNEVFGDIHALVTKVEEQQRILPTAADDATGRLHAEVAHIMAATEQLAAQASAVNKTAEVAQAKIRNTLALLAPAVTSTNTGMTQLGADVSAIADVLRGVSKQYAGMYKALDAKIGTIDKDAITARARFVNAAAALVISATSAITGGVMVLKMFGH